MRKNNTPLRLADSPQEHEQIDHTVAQMVRELCGFGDYALAQTLFQLLDLLTNEKYDSGSRENVAFVAVRECFKYTEGFETALDSEVIRMNPSLLRKAG